jgi:galacturan 1,4-alpha-galacturonidase
MSPNLQGGGGSGSVDNITYDGMTLSNVDYAIEITQRYGQKNLTLCKQYPSNLTISNVLIKNFKGKTSKKYDPVVGYLVCSSQKACSGIMLESIDVTSLGGKNLYTCGNITGIGEQVNCTSTT